MDFEPPVPQAAPADAFASESIEASPNPVPRNYAAWVLLFAIFTLLIAMAVGNAFGSGRKTMADSLMGYEVRLESLISGGTFGMADRQKRSALEDLATDLRATKSQTPYRYALEATIERELGQKVDATTLAKLKSLRSADTAAAGSGGNATNTPAPKIGRVPKDDSEPSATPAVPLEEPKIPYEALLFEGDKKAAEALPRLSSDDRFSSRLALAQAKERAGIPRSQSREGLTSTGTLLRVAFMSLSLLGAGALGLAMWLVFLVNFGKGDFKPKGAPSLPMEPGQADRFALRASLVMLAYLALGGLMSFLIGAVGGQLRSFASVPIYLGLIIYSLTMRPDSVASQLSAKRFGFSRENLTWKEIAWGFGGAMAIIPILVPIMIVSSKFAQNLPAPEHPIQSIFAGGSTVLIIVNILFASIAAPIWEETVFRGMIFQGLLGARLTPVLATIISAFLFGAIHPQGPAGWAGLMTIAAMSSALVWHRRSLIPSVVMHCTWNTMVVTIGLIAGKSFMG